MGKTSNISKRRKYTIIYFIFVFFIIPTINYNGLSSVVGRFIPNPLGYNLLAFILSIPLLRSFNRNYGELRGVISAITALAIYCLMLFFITASETSFYAALTVYRYSYMQAMNLFILLPFMFSLKKEEVDYTLNCIFKCLIVFIFIYLSNNLIYDWLGVKGALTETHGGVSVERNIIGVPPLNPIWIALLMVYTILNVKNAGRYLMFALFTVIITFTRSMLFSTLIIVAVSMTLMVIKCPQKFGRGIKIIAFALFGILLLSIVMPESINFWIAKLLHTFNDEIKYDMGTFAFRELLIEEAIYAIRHNPLFGLGYVRDVAKGEYSLVLGTDTYIAPILWCEGCLGLILRIFPFAILGFTSLYNLLIKKSNYWLDIIILACIVSATVNYVQTNVLTNYPLTLGIIILLKIKENYGKKTKDFSNYSIL